MSKRWEWWWILVGIKLMFDNTLRCHSGSCGVFWLLVLSNKCLISKWKQLADSNVHRYMIFLRLQSVWPSCAILVVDIALVVYSNTRVLFSHVEFWWKHEEKWSWLGIANSERIVPWKMQSWNSHNAKACSHMVFNAPNWQRNQYHGPVQFWLFKLGADAELYCMRACISLFSIFGVNYKSSYMIIVYTFIQK